MLNTVIQLQCVYSLGLNNNIMVDKYTSFEWILRVIKSCKTFNHFLAVERLIDNFHKLHSDYSLTIMLIKLNTHATKNIFIKRTFNKTSN